MKIFTALSTSSLKLYPDNTIAKFCNAVNLQLDPAVEYECALHSVSFVKSWYNFESDDAYYISYVKHGLESFNELRQGDNSNTVHIPRGYYDKTTFTARVVNEDDSPPSPPPSPPTSPKSPPMSKRKRILVRRRPTRWNEVTLSFDPTTYKFRVRFAHMTSPPKKKADGTAREPYDGVILSKALALKTGFSNDASVTGHAIAWTNGEAEQTFYSEHAVNFDPIDHFYLQTSLIKPTHAIGNGLFSVLSTVPVFDLGFGSRQTFTPQERLWYPVSRESLDCPEFVFMSPTGGLMPFEFGTSMVTVLIRPRQDDV